MFTIFFNEIVSIETLKGLYLQAGVNMISNKAAAVICLVFDI